MDLLITPSNNVSGTINIPPSKSLTHRYFIMASLAHGTSEIINPLFSDDTLYTLNALENLGIKVVKNKGNVKIQGNNGVFNSNKNEIYLGDSGTSARLFIGLATLSNKPIIINGSERLKERPNKELFQALEKQGIKIKYLEKQYYLPVEITGNRLKGGVVKISGKISSQFISSLLLISPFAEKGIEIKIVDELKSKPYIDLTIQTMEEFGVKVINNNYHNFIIKSGQKYKSQKIKVEGDYSSASYFIALSYLTNKRIEIQNLNNNSRQADKVILGMIKKIKENKNVVLDISNCPDIGLTLGIIGACTDNSLTLKGVNRLIDKESDRKLALINNLKKLGVRLEEGHNYIKIFRSHLTSAEIDTYNDHRVAMSFAVLGTIIPNGIIIKNAEVINKSYPNFFKDMKKIGVNVKEI